MATKQNDKKTRYSDEELAEFEVIIDAKLQTAQAELEFYRKQISDLGESEESKVKSLEDGNATSENERLLSLAGRQQKLIQHLENAKIRIKNKVYGICRETGQLISKERLKAVPHATLSIAAKNKR